MGDGGEEEAAWGPVQSGLVFDKRMSRLAAYQAQIILPPFTGLPGSKQYALCRKNLLSGLIINLSPRLKYRMLKSADASSPIRTPRVLFYAVKLCMIWRAARISST